MSNTRVTPTSLTGGRAIVRGTMGFTMVSVAGFAVWALAGKWFYAHVGEAGLYAVSFVVFLGLSGLLLHPLVNGPRPLLRFYKIFVPAFLAYALVWCGFWFALHYGAGEWLGSFFGCAAFAWRSRSTCPPSTRSASPSPIARTRRRRRFTTDRRIAWR